MIKKFIDQYLEDFTPYKHHRWCYEDGILLSACVFLYESTHDEKYKEFVLNFLNQHINESGLAEGYEIDNYSIDDIDAAKVLFWAYDQTKLDKYLKAQKIFYHQLENHPRCHCGNFFHKKRYPYQVWMDGLYMGQPFYVQYSLLNKLDDNIEDVINQFKNVRKYLFDEERNLYVHAYDENKVMQWADKITGKAPNVWSRAVGWFAMAIVDIVEIIGDNYHNLKQAIVPLFEEMLSGMMKYIEPVNHMWYQVVDKKDYPGNYLETSGTLMLAYSMLKGVRLGIIEEKYRGIALDIFKGTNKKYLSFVDGKYSLGGICSVAGLDNERRDGSIEYYLSEKIVPNEVKGVAPYLMVASEIYRYFNKYEME